MKKQTTILVIGSLRVNSRILLYLYSLDFMDLSFTQRSADVRALVKEENLVITLGYFLYISP